MLPNADASFVQSITILVCTHHLSALQTPEGSAGTEVCLASMTTQHAHLEKP